MSPLICPMFINSNHESLLKLPFFFLFQMLVSPVLAGLAVAIGVPILLFYVYGVVPGLFLAKLN